MEVIDIVIKYLKDNGYDGLCNDGCCCGINELQCCAEEFESCRPAYLIKNPDCKNCKVTDCYYCGFSEDLPEKCYKEEKPPCPGQYMKEERFYVTADHPTLKRPDKIVSRLELVSYMHELKLAGYENIKAVPVEHRKKGK